jgi:glycogen debranching enzyme
VAKLLLLLGLMFSARAAWAGPLDPIPAFFSPPQGLRIEAPCQPGKPWTVAGEYGALFGRQNGRFEIWQWPVKLLSNFSISAQLADYAVPIDVNALAAHIRVMPAETVITYSHAAFTIHQHMFAPRASMAPAFGALAIFEIESARPLALTFSFTPEMLRMWPAPNYGRPNGSWTSQGRSGYYILNTDDPKFSGIVAMPRTQPGILVPYQEHPQTYPLQLKLEFDPARDHGQIFPLFAALKNETAPLDQLKTMAASITGLYEQTMHHYQSLLATRLAAQTPDQRVNEGLAWAEVSIDQMQVINHGELGLVAGYYESADSARPGYAWFFGRDTLWTTYAINSYGDFPLTRNALDFLIRRQRPDGKIMHEFSQTADSIDWKATPYFFAAADSTPLLVMAMRDYVQSSGDTEYLKINWEAVKKAYAFTRRHEGDDGIYKNSEGTGWVESWPPGMPKEEIYLAALDEQSSDAISHLAAMMKDQSLAESARAKAAAIRAKIESEYYEPRRRFYAFSRSSPRSLDGTASIYPAVAWWDGTLALPKADEMFGRWASSEFSADWGTRDISPQTSFYDPISYHQGSIWPLFTGWVSLAEYRTGRDLSGYSHLMQNLNLTWSQDLGSVTELLSGEFFQELGRSSSHQMWSSAMVLSPLIRGLFGLDWDVPKHTLHLTPYLPADWDSAQLKNVPFGTTTLDLDFEREGRQLIIRGVAKDQSLFCLENGEQSNESCRPSPKPLLELPLRPVEIAVPAHLPEPGAVTTQLKVLSETYSANEASYVLEAQGGSVYDLPLRTNGSLPTVAGAAIEGKKLRVRFPSGPGYQRTSITLRW